MREGREVLKGHITIFAALSYMLVINLIVICITSAVKVNGETQVDMASRLALESAFAGYCTELMDEFDIMALERNQLAGKLLRHYAKTNIEGICGSGVEYIYGDFESSTSMIAVGGTGVEHQIIQYMNVGVLSEALQDMLDIEKETKKTQVVEDVAEAITKCESYAGEADSIIYDVIELVEGIKTSEGGLVLHNGKAVITGELFAKAIITEPLSKKSAAVDSDAVYAVISGMGNQYTNVYELIDNMQEYSQVYNQMGNAEDESDSETQGQKDCQSGYDETYKQLMQTVSGAIEKCKDAISKLDEYDNKIKESKSAYMSCKDYVESNGEILGEELSQSLKADIDALRNPNSYTGAKICNVAYMRSGLKHNLGILSKAFEDLERLNIRLKDKTEGYVQMQLGYGKDCFYGISNNLLKFNYQYVSFTEGQGLKVIETLKNALQNGFSGLVMQEKEVSAASIQYTDLASSYKGSVSTDSKSVIDEATDLLLVNEYILRRFPNASDCIRNKENNEAGWCQLNYVVEYILCGKNNDRDNLSGVLAKMAAIREGVNMVHLIMDKEKKQEALVLATSLVGASGNGVAVKAAQYLIMAVWALGESVCDLQLLLDGDTLPLVKTKADWKLSLSNLLSMNFRDWKKEDNRIGNEKDTGLLRLSYKDHLRMLLLVQNREDKRYATMDAMELRMMALGHDGFRMRNYIWRGKALITVRYSDTGEYNTREISYSYV